MNSSNKSLKECIQDYIKSCTLTDVHTRVSFAVKNISFFTFSSSVFDLFLNPNDLVDTAPDTNHLYYLEWHNGGSFVFILSGVSICWQAREATNLEVMEELSYIKDFDGVDKL